MGSKDRRQTSSLMEGLLKHSRDFGYFQSVRLISLLEKAGKGSLVRTRPELSFSFPTSDISSISLEEDDHGRRYEIIATFLGLYGVSSPLPNFYTEDLFLESSEDRSTQRDFLDIFNQRFYDLLFQCWQKYQMFFQVTEEKSRDHMEALYCLLGIGEDELRAEIGNPSELIRYLGILTQWPRSALGLKTLLRAMAGIKSLDIEPCVFRFVKIPEDQRCCLGQNCSRLGADTVIGTKISDRQGKFRISMGPVSAKEFQDIVPGSRGYRQMVKMTRFYLAVPLDYEIRVILGRKDIRNSCLGTTEWSRLGTDTWLFSGKMTQDGTATFYPQ